MSRRTQSMVDELAILTQLRGEGEVIITALGEQDALFTPTIRRLRDLQNVLTAVRASLDRLTGLVKSEIIDPLPDAEV